MTWSEPRHPGRRWTTRTRRIGRPIAATLGLALLTAGAAAEDPASDYQIFIRPLPDQAGTPAWVGDPIPYAHDGEIAIHYLHEERPNPPNFHPWYLFTTTDFASYTDHGRVIQTGGPADQDFAIGTGSIIETAPVAAHWRFDDFTAPSTDGDAVGVDESGGVALRWDGATPAPASAPGAAGGALRTQIGGGGSTRLWAPGDVAEGSDSFTVSLFVNPVEVGDATGPKVSLIAKEGSVVPGWGVELLDADTEGQTRLNFFVFDQTSAADVQTPPGSIARETNDADPAWRHVVASYDSVTGTLRLWLDGVEHTSAATGLSGSPRHDGGEVSLGARDGAFPVDGLVARYDAVQLYARALTGEDVAALGADASAAVEPLFYAFYTGFNYLFPGQGLPREATMLATSVDLRSWQKRPGFETLPPPAGSVYDDDFRDPFVFVDPDTGVFRMLVSSRNKFNFDGLLAEYRSADLWNWTLQPTPFNTFVDEPVPEVATLFEAGGVWYLVYSRPTQDSSRGSYYRTGDSPDGPWSVRRRLDGRAFFSGTTVSDGATRYLLGWCPTKEGETNAGDWQWAGNLVAHRIVIGDDGLLSLAPIPAIEGLFTGACSEMEETARTGQVNTDGVAYTLSGSQASVRFSPFTERRMLSGTITMDASVGLAGLTIGGRDVVFDHVNNELRHGPDNHVSIPLDPGVAYEWRLIAEGTMAALYVTDPQGCSVGMTIRDYGMLGGEWGIFSTGGQTTFGDLRSVGVLGPPPAVDDPLVSHWTMSNPDPQGTPYSNSVPGGPVLAADPATAPPGTFDPEQTRLETSPDPHTRLAASDPSLDLSTFSFSAVLDPTDMFAFASILQKESAAPETFADFQRVGWQVLHVGSGDLELVVRGADPATADFFGNTFVAGAQSGFPGGADFIDQTRFHVAGGYDASSGSAAFYVTPLGGGTLTSLIGGTGSFTPGATQDASPLSAGTPRSGGDIVGVGAGYDLDDLQIYDRLLTTPEFLHLANHPGTPLPAGPTSHVDLAPPYGQLSCSDVSEFIRLFDLGDPSADLAAPAGVLDFADVAAFLDDFDAAQP